MPQLTANDIARYFLSRMSDDCGDTVSNLKLQKLVYYAQGFYLALYDKPLFEEQIRAWQHGPVVVSLYHRYSSFGAGAIPSPDDFDLSIYPVKVKRLLDDIWKVYGQFSAWKLRNMTHDEPPYANTNPNGVITRQSMKDFFRPLVKK